MPENHANCYQDAMQPEQKIIANWLTRTKQKLGWSWTEWTKRAEGVASATTLSRAVKEDYGSVTSVETLHALARAAHLPSVLDFLAGQASHNAVNAEALTPLLAAVLPRMPKQPWSDQDFRLLAEALEYGLGLALAPDANSPMQDRIGVAARAAVDRFHEGRQPA